MAVIETGKGICVENVLSLRKKIRQEEMNIEMNKIGNFFKTNGIKKSGPVITTTYAVVEDGVLDIEILVPMDKAIELPTEYRFKPVFKLVNALRVRHEGDPTLLQGIYNEMIDYIKKNNLQQITTGYNVTIKDIEEGMNLDEWVIDVYIGVSENLL